MLHLAVLLGPRESAEVLKTAYFVVAPIDNLITLCQVKSNCPRAVKVRRKSPVSHHGRVRGRHATDQHVQFGLLPFLFSLHAIRCHDRVSQKLSSQIVLKPIFFYRTSPCIYIYLFFFSHQFEAIPIKFGKLIK